MTKISPAPCVTCSADRNFNAAMNNLIFELDGLMKVFPLEAFDFKGSSYTIDLLVQERLVVKQTKKKSFSFQEMKAIALLMTRMTSKGNRSRLQSLEAIEEAAFKEQEIIRTISKNIERFNALEEEIKPDSLSVSIIYPAEGALFSSAGMKN